MGTIEQEAAYAYQADVYCEACTRDIKQRIRKEGPKLEPGDEHDSDSWPQECNGMDEESDRPQHCGSGSDCLCAIELSDGRKIGALLEGSLTAEGERFVQDEHQSKPTEVTALWMEAFEIEIDEHFAREWRRKGELNPFIIAYIECALWSSTTYDEEGNGGESLEAQNYDIDDIAGETLAEMIRDCLDFQVSQRALLTEWTNEQAGHDFWLTRNGHGAGFWDRGIEPAGRKLTEASKPYGSYDLMVGDDGLIYGS